MNDCIQNNKLKLVVISSLYKISVIVLLVIITGDNLADILNWGDVPSYLEIAESFPWPYQGPTMLANVKHYPLYPFLLFLINLVFHNLLFSAYLSVILIGALSVLVFYRIASRYTKHAFLLSVLFCCFPPKGVQVSMYPLSEPIFVLILLLAVLCFMENRYLLAYFALSMLFVSRPLGLLFFPSFLYFDFIYMRRWANIKYVCLSLVPFLLFHLYLYLTWGEVLLLVHAGRYGGWGGSIFSYPFAGLISGLGDSSLIWIRKGYTLIIFLFYSMVFLWGCLYLRKKDFFLLSIIIIPYFIFCLFLKGGNYNWWMLSLPRFLLPLAPFGIILLCKDMERKFILSAIFVFAVLGYTYTIGSYFLHLKYGPMV